MFSQSSLNHVYRTVWNDALGAMVAVAENAPSHQSSGRTGGAVARSRGLGALSQLALAVALVWSAAPQAYANPEGGAAIHGQASMASNGNVLTVTTQNGAGTNHSAINWQSFSIPAGSTTQIVQPSAASMSINRVVTNTPSLLFGTLSSNGQVVLVNQAGIAVGNGALVDTAGFTASAVGMTQTDAMAGRLRFAGDGISNTTGALTVQGNIIARGGDVVLIAPSVEVAQTAVVESQGGSVVLAAGQSVEVTGRGLEGITLQVQAPTDQALNLGTLKGDAVGIFAGTLKHSGVIQATQASVEGGRVLLKASDDAYVEGSGRIDATNTTGKGGTIQVLGNRVAVTDNAVLDASGATKGGTVLVGGDYQGKNDQVQNADITYFGADATLKADATHSGDGGKIVVWADDTTRAYGRLSARGGLASGNGGFVEASGHRYLDFQGRADIGAPLGKAGLLLLDPNDITIDNSTDNFAGASFGGGIFSGGTGNPILTWATINAQTGSLEVRTNSVPGSGSGDININASGVVTGPTTLTLLANRGLNIANAVSVSGAGDFNLVAGWNNSGFAVNPGANNIIAFGTGSSVSTTGNVWLNAGNSVTGAAASITANTLTIGNTNPASLPGGVNLSGTNMVNTLAVQSDGGGALTFTNGKALTIGAGAYSINGIVAGGNPQPINISTTVGDLTVDKAIVSDVMGGASITLTAAGALNVNSAVTSTSNYTPQGPIKLVAGAGGVTSTVAGILTTNTLEVISGGPVSLNAPNVVTTLAASTTGAGFGFTNSNDFAVGVAGATTGLTVASGDITLTAAGLNKKLTVSSNVTATLGNAIYVTDNINHTAFTTTSGAAGKFVEIKPFTSSTAIEFDAANDAPGVMRLSSAELNFSTPMLKLGNSATTGGITFKQAVTPVNFSTLSLINGSSILQTTGSILTIANLNIDGASGVVMTEANAVTGKLGGSTNAASFSFNTTGAVVLAQVDVNNGITSTSGNITLNAGGAVSEGAGVIVDTSGTINITAVGGITLNNNNTGSTITLNNSGSGNISYVANKPGVSMNATNVGAGNISLSNVAAAGPLTVTNAATGSGNISLSSVGSLTLDTATTSGNVTVSSSGGAIVDGNFSATNITGAVVDLIAATGIATNADTLGVDASSVVNGQSTAGSIYLTTSSNLPVGLISAPGTVSLESTLGSIDDANGATNNISAASAVLSAYSGIGVGNALETQLGSLSANAGMTGDILIENTGTLSLGTLTPGSGYRWLIYAANPASVTKNSVTSNFRHYGATYSTYSSPSETGNGFIYASPAGTFLVDTTLSSGSATNIYGLNPTAVFSYTISNPSIADSEDLPLTTGTVSYTPSLSASTNAGSYTVQYGGGLSNPAGYGFAPGAGVAYTVTSAILSVVTADLTGATSKIYDGGLAAILNSSNYLLSGFVGSDSATVTQTQGTYASKDVGSGIGVSAALTATDFVPIGSTLLSNYTLPTIATGNIGVITPKPLTLTPAAGNKVYDGTVAATVGYALAGFITGESVKAAFTSAVFDSKDVGTAKKVSISGITLADDTGLASNYSVPNAATAAANIDPAALSISATASNKVYDGTRAATVSLADNRITGDTLVLGFSAADFIDSDVGVAKAVTVMGIGVSGVDAGNYTYNTTASSVADITAAPTPTPTPIPNVDLNAPSDMVVTFFEKFQVALQSEQPDPIVSIRPKKDGDEDVSNRTEKDEDKDKLRAKDSIVLEGETCKP